MYVSLKYNDVEKEILKEKRDRPALLPHLGLGPSLNLEAVYRSQLVFGRQFIVVLAAGTDVTDALLAQLDWDN